MRHARNVSRTLRPAWSRTLVAEALPSGIEAAPRFRKDKLTLRHANQGLVDTLTAFAANVQEEPLLFPSTLDGYERKMIHRLAARFNLISKSTGHNSENTRAIVVWHPTSKGAPDRTHRRKQWKRNAETSRTASTYGWQFSEAKGWEHVPVAMPRNGSSFRIATGNPVRTSYELAGPTIMYYKAGRDVDARGRLLRRTAQDMAQGGQAAKGQHAKSGAPASSVKQQPVRGGAKEAERNARVTTPPFVMTVAENQQTLRANAEMKRELKALRAQLTRKTEEPPFVMTVAENQQTLRANAEMKRELKALHAQLTRKTEEAGMAKGALQMVERANAEMKVELKASQDAASVATKQASEAVRLAEFVGAVAAVAEAGNSVHLESSSGEEVSADDHVNFAAPALMSALVSAYAKSADIDPADVEAALASAAPGLDTLEVVELVEDVRDETGRDEEE